MQSSFAVIGCGYVGADVAVSMKYAGHHVLGTTRSRRRFRELHDIVHEPHVLDLTDPDGDLTFLERQDGVLISVAPTESMDDLEAVFSTGIRNLARALRSRTSSQHLHVTYISTAGVYGNQNGDLVDEESPLDAINPVNRMLGEAETLLLSIDRPDTTICVLRLGGIYGPGRDMVSIIRQAAGEQIPKNGNSIPAWSSLLDITSGVQFAFDNNLEGIYNLVDDMQLSRRQLSNEICDLDGLPPVIWANQDFKGARAMNAKVSNQKLKSAGFRFKSPSMLMASVA